MFKFKTERIFYPLPEGNFVYKGKKFRYFASFNFNTSSQDISINFKNSCCVFITRDGDRYSAMVINSNKNPVKGYNMQSFVTAFLNSIRRREHKTGQLMEEVEEATSYTSEDTHGGESIANEVINGKPRGGNMSSANKNEADTADLQSSVAQQQHEINESNRIDAGTQQVVAGNLQDAQHPETPSSGTNSSPCPAKASTEEVGTGKSTDRQGGLQDVTEQAPVDRNAKAGSVGDSLMDAVAEAGDGMLGSQSHTASELDAVLASLENNKEIYINRRYFNLPYKIKNAEEFLNNFIDLSKKIDNYLFKKLKLVFKKYIDNIGIGQTNPELDKKLLIKNIISFKNPYNSYKRNKTNKKIIIMVDTSGSMTNFYDIIPYWIKFAQLYKQETLLILHNNTKPYAIIDNGKIMEIDSIYYQEGIEFYKQFIKQYTIPLVVAFTDWDGIENYVTLLQQTNTKLLALDVYACNYGDPIQDNNKIPEQLKPYKKQIIYYYRVKNFEQSLEILKNEL